MVLYLSAGGKREVSSSYWTINSVTIYATRFWIFYAASNRTNTFWCEKWGDKVIFFPKIHFNTVLRHGLHKSQKLMTLVSNPKLLDHVKNITIHTPLALLSIGQITLFPYLDFWSSLKVPITCKTELVCIFLNKMIKKLCY